MYCTSTSVVLHQHSTSHISCIQYDTRHNAQYKHCTDSQNTPFSVWVSLSLPGSTRSAHFHYKQQTRSTTFTTVKQLYFSPGSTLLFKSCITEARHKQGVENSSSNSILQVVSTFSSAGKKLIHQALCWLVIQACPFSCGPLTNLPARPEKVGKEKRLRMKGEGRQGKASAVSADRLW